MENPEPITEANWEPGLPPPIEALERRFPPEAGYSIEYCWWVNAGSPNLIPVAAVVGADGTDRTIFPEPAPDPVLGERFQDAVAYAVGLHRRQPRKETSIPYAAHLLAVAALVLEDG